jgi:hypothetical protein
MLCQQGFGVGEHLLDNLLVRFAADSSSQHGMVACNVLKDDLWIFHRVCYWPDDAVASGLAMMLARRGPRVALPEETSLAAATHHKGE